MSFIRIVCSRVFSTLSDDKVEEDHLATAFDVTCRAWTVRCTNLNRTHNKLMFHHCRTNTRSHIPIVDAQIREQLLASAYDVFSRETNR